MNKPTGALGVVLLLLAARGIGAQETTPDFHSKVTQTHRVYKTVDARELLIHLTFPPGWKDTDGRPVIVFFFGGGWSVGSVRQFAYQADYFASRGMVAARAEYRIKSRDKVSPDKCVEDARSAIRWIRRNASSLGVDPNKLVASGGSAGGHLAACQFIKNSVEDSHDDLSISTVPQAMVLFNPALDFTRGKGLMERIHHDKQLAQKISPTLNLDKNTPPAILFYGMEDSLALPEGMAYSEKAKELGIRADMFFAKGQGHGFFNRSPWLQRTTIAADKFLFSLGLLEGEPTLQEP